MFRPLALALALALVPVAASAGTMTLDPVFVSRFVPVTTADQREAAHVRTLLESRLGAEFLLISRDDVPAFEDYTSEVYLASCPPDQFFGCAFVIGDRASAEWTITGEVSSGANGPHVNVVFIDVAESRMVFSFEADVPAAEETAFADGVAKLLHKIVEGAAETHDVRGAIVDPVEKARRDKLQAQALAAELSDLEGDLGAMARTVSSGEIEPPKLTKEDLHSQFADADEAKPWERIGMDEDEYIRFKNSKKPLKEWRSLAHGRFAKVMFSGSIGTANGPFSQQFDGRSARDATTLDIKEVDEFQEVENGGGIMTEGEISFGVHKWIDVGFAATGRGGHYAYLFNSEVEGQVGTEPDPNLVDPPHTSLMTSTQFSARVHFSPFATSPYRPTGFVGLGSWSGTSIDHVSQTPPEIVPLHRPLATILEIGAGGELDAGRVVSVFTNVIIDVPLAGSFVQKYQDGPQTIVNRGSPDGPRGIGGEFALGVRVRVGPLVKLDDNGPKTFDDDEPVD